MLLAWAKGEIEQHKSAAATEAMEKARMVCLGRTGRHLDLWVPVDS